MHFVSHVKYCNAFYSSFSSNFLGKVKVFKLWISICFNSFGLSSFKFTNYPTSNVFSNTPYRQINFYKKIFSCKLICIKKYYFFSIFSTIKHGKYLCNIYLKYPKIKKFLGLQLFVFFYLFLFKKKNIPT